MSVSKQQSFKVARVFPTKEKTARYKFILHLAVSVKLDVKDADGKVIGQDESTMYFRKGSDFEVKEDDTMVLSIDQYNVTTHATEWIDKESGEQRKGQEHWLTPKVTL
tara:strand:- start:383 stop:706 length:324 start_codon:yes stop_codon:yes gene_type:complete